MIFPLIYLTEFDLKSKKKTFLKIIKGCNYSIINSFNTKKGYGCKEIYLTWKRVYIPFFFAIK